jgi:hypothetical protein
MIPLMNFLFMFISELKSIHNYFLIT